MKTKITTMPNILGWKGREYDFRLMQELYGKENVQYTMFLLVHGVCVHSSRFFSNGNRE